MKSNKNLNIPSILDNTPKECRLDVAFSLLTPLQQEIMRIFLEKKSALSSYEVWKNLITKKFDVIPKDEKPVFGCNIQKNEKAMLKAKEDYLKKMGVYIPSYRKMENKLQTLVSYGLLVHIEAERSRAKSLYALNPEFISKVTQNAR